MTVKTKINSPKMHISFLNTLILFSIISGCAKSPEEAATTGAGSSDTSRYLYLATGSCYSGGGLTTYTNLTATNKIYRVNVNSGAQPEARIADYFDVSKSQAGDTPVAIANYDANNIYVLVQNATAGLKRIDKIAKSSDPIRNQMSNNATIFSANVRSLAKTGNGDFLISKSTAIERMSGADLSRIPSGANPYVNAPAAPCATSTTLFTRVGTLSNEMIYFLHAATAQNRIGFVKASGYAAGGDCTPAQAAPNASAFPTASAYDSANQILLVAYGGSSAVTADINSIYAYKLNVTSNSVSITSSHKIYDQTLFPATYSFQLFGIPAMALDSQSNSLFVASAISTAATVAGYRVEKLTYNAAQVGVNDTLVLTRPSSTVFLSSNSDTKCVSDMFVAE